MKKFLIIAVFTFSIIFLNSSNTYAYSIETLDSNPDLHEISRMEDEIYRWAQGAVEDENTNLQIDYSRAVKIYIDTNIFEQEELTAENLQDTLDNAVYIWEVPVKVSEDRYVIVTVSRALPIDEELQQELLEDGTYTQEELEMELEKVGSWTIPTAGYDETKSDYIGKLDSVLGETLNKEDLDMIYLLGGTPKMRQPFGVVCREGKYQIVTLDVVTGENDISAFSSEESQELNENSIYSFEQVKEVIESMPEVDDESDTGLAPTLKKENIKKENAKKERIYGVVVLLVTVLLVGVAMGKKLKRKK